MIVSGPMLEGQRGRASIIRNMTSTVMQGVL